MKSKELGSCLPGAVLVEEVSNLNQTHSTFVDLDLVAANGLSLLTGFVVQYDVKYSTKKSPQRKSLYYLCLYQSEIFVEC